MKIRRIFITLAACLVAGLGELALIYWIFVKVNSGNVASDIIVVVDIICLFATLIVATGIILSSLWSVSAAQRDYRNTSIFYDIARGLILGLCAPFMGFLYQRFGTFNHFMEERSKEWNKKD